MKKTRTATETPRRNSEDTAAGGERKSAPLGATVVPGGLNFSVFSKHATGIELLLFDRVDDAQPARVIRIDPAANRTYHYWHVLVPGLQLGQFRADTVT